MTFHLLDLTPIALAFAGTAILTPLVRAAARRLGMVARPKSDRWHTRPTALLGGVAIFAVVAVATLASVPLKPKTFAVLGSASFLFLLGLVDDLRALKPYQKLIGQVLGASVVIASGLALPWTGSPALDLAITLVWLVGLTNAVNLLDTMDGLAAGISAVAAGFLALHCLAGGLVDEAKMLGIFAASLLGIFAASLLGFLLYNANPASIFMGDCGSMFIGFYLAASALLDAGSGRARAFLPTVCVPVLVLFIPIFDTLLVMVLRKLAGRPISRGGRDHASHRLVALGLSERRAVWMLYALSAASGGLALLVSDRGPDVGLAAIVGFSLLLALLGIFLGGVRVYDEAEVRAARDRPLVAFLVDISYKRRVFEVLLDVALIALSYYAAHLLVFGSIGGGGGREVFLRTVPLLVTVKLAAFLVLGVYRGMWRYVSVGDLLVYARAVVAGSAATLLALLLAFRFAGFSRAVFALDGLILLVLLAGSRLSFRLLRRALPSGSSTAGPRVLIYGAGDAGALLAREILGNASLNYTPVGFADDDPMKTGKVIHGLPVLGGNGSFQAICGRHAVEEVFISSALFPPERIEQIARDCRAASVTLKRLRLQLETMPIGAPLRPEIGVRTAEVESTSPALP